MNTTSIDAPRFKPLPESEMTEAQRNAARELASATQDLEKLPGEGRARNTSYYGRKDRQERHNCFHNV